MHGSQAFIRISAAGQSLQQDDMATISVLIDRDTLFHSHSFQPPHLVLIARRAKGILLPLISTYVKRAHRHVCLPAKVVPVESDGGVVKQGVLIKVAVEHGDSPSATLQRCAPNLRNESLELAVDCPHKGQGCDASITRPSRAVALRK